MPASPLLEIRADGGGRFGFGHVGRCLALAHAMDGAAAFCVADEATSSFVRHHGGRLTGPGNAAAPVVLLDRVAPTPAEEVRRLQTAGSRVALLDDFGTGREVAELVIDPPTGTGWPPAVGTRLDGFEHVLLRAEVLDATPAADPRGVLVAIGGSDPAGLTEPVTDALAAAGLPVAAALGPGYAGAVPRSADELIEADAFVAALAQRKLLVSGYGHSLLEAAYLGIPAIAVVRREDQVPHARAFCGYGIAAMVDASAAARPEEIAEAASELLADDRRRREMAARGRELVDGRGASRVAEALRSLA